MKFVVTNKVQEDTYENPYKQQLAEMPARCAAL